MNKLNIKWRPPSLSGLTPMIFSMGLTHLGSEASKYLVFSLKYFLSLKNTSHPIKPLFLQSNDRFILKSRVSVYPKGCLGQKIQKKCFEIHDHPNSASSSSKSLQKLWFKFRKIIIWNTNYIHKDNWMKLWYGIGFKIKLYWNNNSCRDKTS